MTLLTKLLALATLAITATSALPTAETNIATRDPPWCKPCPPGKYCQCVPDENPPPGINLAITANTNLTARDDELHCFDAGGPGADVPSDYYAEPIQTFCSRYDAGLLHHETTFRSVYDSRPSTGDKVALSVTNPYCTDDQYIEGVRCMEILNNVKNECGSTGGWWMYGCGHYILLPIAPGAPTGEE